MEEECIHGMPQNWCALCNGALKKFEEDSKEPKLTFEGLLNGSRESGN